jgi:hypothetical protein
MYWLCRPELSFQLVVDQAHRTQECISARVLSKVGKERIAQHEAQASVALQARSLQPFERPVLVPSIRVEFGDVSPRSAQAGTSNAGSIVLAIWMSNQAPTRYKPATRITFRRFGSPKKF